MNIYYVYAYLRSKDSKTAKAGTPYYIGKGKDNRAYVKHSSIPKPVDKKYIVILEHNLSEVGALALERRMIRWYGRIDNNTGILRNKTDGGDGSGRSQETKDKIRKTLIGRKRGPMPEWHRKNIAKHNIGKKQSEGTKMKRSLALAGRPQTKVACPHCHTVGGVSAMKRYHLDKCKFIQQQ
jgi:hypothetical protein